MLDIAIIGIGPAGLSAAVTGAQLGKDVMVIGMGVDNTLLYKAEKVDDYLGLPERSGRELLEEFVEHAVKKDVKMKKGRVSQIMPVDDYFMVNVDGELINAKTVVLATGIARSACIKGEERFLGAGVSYCASCDAMLYMDKTVVMVSETPSDTEDMALLSDLCKKVYYLPLYEYQGTPAHNVTILSGTPEEVFGNGYVAGIKISGKEIKCDGVFFIKNVQPPGSVVYNLGTIGNVVSVNKNMETNIPGLFAAGDCTGAPFKIAKAVGEGLVAAERAAKTIRRKERVAV